MALIEICKLLLCLIRYSGATCRLFFWYACLGRSACLGVLSLVFIYI